jgi:hypothetical protein
VIEQISTNTPIDSSSRGLVKVLLVGIDYEGSPYQLSGCINDINNIKQDLQRYYPSCNNYRVITDRSDIKPTKQNILAGFDWLVADLQPGQNVYFHFSGHGDLITDVNGIRPSKQNCCIYAINAGRLETILDKEIPLEKNLPEGSKCISVMDACHSGTAMELRYNWTTPTATTIVMSENTIFPETRGNILNLSACADGDVAIEVTDNSGRGAGPLTFALRECMREHGTAIKMNELLWHIRDVMKQKGLSQMPQMSTGRRIDPNIAFDLNSPN